MLSANRPSFTQVVDELYEIEASMPKGGLDKGGNSKEDSLGDALDGLISHK